MVKSVLGSILAVKVNLLARPKSFATLKKLENSVWKLVFIDLKNRVSLKNKKLPDQGADSLQNYASNDRKHIRVGKKMFGKKFSKILIKWAKIFCTMSGLRGGQFEFPLVFRSESSEMAPKWFKWMRTSYFNEWNSFNYDFGGFETIFGSLKLSISTTITGDHYRFGGLNFQTSENRPKIVPKPQNHTLNCFIRQNELFFVHLIYSEAIPDLPAEFSGGRAGVQGGGVSDFCPPPPISAENFLKKSQFCTKLPQNTIYLKLF